ncbi:MAG: penicillin-binding protein activator LpoB, partial [Deltaproteobacteria bacterium]|nr:penicillin-binding protein activator LpoB [Deltaproteobacteria bacterium]
QLGLTSNPSAIGKELGANFVVTGVINSIEDREGGEKVVFYQTNLEMINVETNEKVWIGDKKIKKFIDQSGLKL